MFHTPYPRSPDAPLRESELALTPGFVPRSTRPIATIQDEIPLNASTLASTRGILTSTILGSTVIQGNNAPPHRNFEFFQEVVLDAVRECHGWSKVTMKSVLAAYQRVCVAKGYDSVADTVYYRLIIRLGTQPEPSWRRKLDRARFLLEGKQAATRYYHDKLRGRVLKGWRIVAEANPPPTVIPVETSPSQRFIMPLPVAGSPSRTLMGLSELHEATDDQKAWMAMLLRAWRDATVDQNLVRRQQFFRRYWLGSRTFTLWRVALLRAKNEHRLVSDAVNLRTRQLLSRFLHEWRLHTRVSVNRHRMIDVLRRIIINSHVQRRFTSLTETAGSFFPHASLKRESTALYDWALLSAGFEALKMNATEGAIVAEVQPMADRLFLKAVQKHALQHWRAAAQHSQRSRNMVRLFTLRRYFRMMRRIVRKADNFEDFRTLAEVFYNARIAHRTFHALKEVLKLQSWRMTELNYQADTFIKKRALKEWRLFLREHILLGKKEETFRNNKASRLLKKTLHLYRSRLADRVERRRAVVDIRVRYESRLIQQIFSAWRTVIHTEQAESALLHLRRKNIQTAAFHSWFALSERLQAFKAKRSRNLDRNALTNSFYLWHSSACYRKNSRTADELRGSILMHTTLLKWRQALSNLSRVRFLQSKASEFRKVHLYRVLFTASMMAIKTHQTEKKQQKVKDLELLRKYFHRFMEGCDILKIENAKLMLIQRRQETRLKRLVFAGWTQEMVQHRHRMQNLHLAAAFRNRALALRALNVWNNQLKIANGIRVLVSKTNLSLARKAFSGWIRYGDNVQISMKRVQAMKAKGTLLRAFLQLKSEFRERVKLLSNLESINDQRILNIKASIFNNWRVAAEESKIQRFRLRSLGTRMFDGFRSYSYMTHCEQIISTKHRRDILSRCFHTLKLNVSYEHGINDRCIDLQRKILNDPVSQHRAQRLVSIALYPECYVAFHTWLRFARIEKVRKDQVKVAMNHYLKNRVHSAFQSWHTQALIARRERINAQDAAILMLSRVFTSWRAVAHEEARIIRLTRQANNIFLTKVINSWRTQAKLRSNCSEATYRFANRQRLRLLLYSFQAWHDRYLYTQSLHSAANTYVERHERELLAGVLCEWRAVLTEKLSKSFREKRQKRLFYRAWREKLKWVQTMQQAADAFKERTASRKRIEICNEWRECLRLFQVEQKISAQHQLTVLRPCFRAFQVHVEHRHHVSEMTQIAHNHYNRVLCQKAFEACLNRHRWYFRLKNLKEKIKRNTLRACFTQWEKSIAELATQQKAFNIIQRINAEHMTMAVFSRWRSTYQLRSLERRSVCGRFFNSWRHAHRLHQYEELLYTKARFKTVPLICKSAFSSWTNQYHRHKDLERLGQLFLKLFEETQLHECFRRWKEQTSSTSTAIIAADANYQRKIAERILINWRNLATNRATQRNVFRLWRVSIRGQKIVQAAAVITEITSKEQHINIFLSWHQTTIAVKFHRLRLLRKYFDIINDEYLKNVLIRRRQRSILQHCFQGWRLYIQVHSLTKRYKIVADRYRRHRILQKYLAKLRFIYGLKQKSRLNKVFFGWRDYVTVKQKKEKRIRNAIRGFDQRRRKRRISIAFQGWKKVTLLEKRAIQRKLEKSFVHKRNAMNAWRSAFIAKQRLENANAYYEARLVSIAFEVWKEYTAQKKQRDRRRSSTIVSQAIIEDDLQSTQSRDLEQNGFEADFGILASPATQRIRSSLRLEPIPREASLPYSQPKRRLSVLDL